jgi:hypothetical protein
MKNAARRELIQQIAEQVRKLISRYPTARDRFIEQLKVHNDAWEKRWKSLDGELQPTGKQPDKDKKDAYEYDRGFKCWFPKDEAKLPPDPTRWELHDKYPSYYAALAVVYDSEEGKDALYKLCEGILDKKAAWFIKNDVYEVWLDEKVEKRLHIALDWVKADIEERQEKDGQGNISGMRWQDAQKKAESIVDRAGFRGFEKLKKAVGCGHKQTLRKAIENSPKLTKAEADYKATSRTLKAVGLTENVLATYEQPSEGKSISDTEVEEILAELLRNVEEVNPGMLDQTRAELKNMDEERRRRLAETYKGTTLSKDEPQTPRQYKKV